MAAKSEREPGELTPAEIDKFRRGARRQLREDQEEVRVGPARYRITVFGMPRTDWRETADEAMADAVAAELASWDEECGEHFLAVPVDMEVERIRER